MTIYPTPSHFTVEHPFPYPPDNFLIFERWFLYNPALTDNYVYLPVQWTAYYVKHSFGKDITAINNLQEFLRSLPRDKKYYTIVQYDDGILNDISHLDIIVFGMSAKPDIAIPLVCMPHGIAEGVDNRYIASFVGRDTHPIRNKLNLLTRNRNDWFVRVSQGQMGLKDYAELMRASTFSICPRGYGNTSFRICEALEQGSIPVYISDDPMLPFNDIIPFESYGLVFRDMNESVIERLESMSGVEIAEKAMMGRHAYNRLYTYAGLRETIGSLL
jgi:hypothetical protein